MKAGQKGSSKRSFFNSTGNAGFYTICDRKGGHTYPIAMQSKVAPMIQEVKRLASLEKTSAALPSERKLSLLDL